MKDPSGLIRTWVYNTLYGAVSYSGSTVPVYSFAPKDQSMPYILIAQQSGDTEMDESTKDTWLTRQRVTIEIYASHSGNDASYVPVNTIADSVIQLIRTRVAATISGYTVVGRVFDGSITDHVMMDNQIVTMKILNFTLIMEET